MYKYLVVIQGPLVSTGNSGSGSKVLDYDCEKNIKNLILEFSDLPIHFILSTWEGEKDLGYSFKNLNIIKNSKPFKSKGDSYQMISSLNGFLSIKFIHEYKLALKMRTDQFIDLRSIFEHMEKWIFSNSNTKKYEQNGLLFFPNFLPWSPYSVGDFFIGGTPEDLINFFQSQIKYEKNTISDYAPWTHSEIIYKYAITNFSKNLSLKYFYFYPRIEVDFRREMKFLSFLKGYTFPIHVLKLWKIMMCDLICFFPKDIHEKIIWRGTNFSANNHDSGSYFEDWVDYKNNMYSSSILNFPTRFKQVKKISLLQIFLSFSIEKPLELKSSVFYIITFPIKLLRHIFFLISFKRPMSDVIDKISIKYLEKVKKILKQLIE